MRSLLIVSLVVKIVSSLDDKLGREEFERFKTLYDKRYASIDEENYRYSLFAYRYDRVAQVNAMFSLGQVPYQLAIYSHSDSTLDEYINLRGGLLDTIEFRSARSARSAHLVNEVKNDTHDQEKSARLRRQVTQVDWRSRGRVTPVKNQLNCGSCWAFAAVGALEGHWSIKNNRLLNYSEQNLIDCTNRNQYGNRGCNGGLMTFAYEYIRDNAGINNQATYPYEGVNTTCRFKRLQSNPIVTGVVRLPFGNETALEEAVRDKGPVAVGINIGEDFVYYLSGVLLNTMCTTTLNHAVLVVGFNNAANPPYWIVKNSWGTSWGNRGYIFIEKGKNACGIANLASYPIV